MREAFKFYKDIGDNAGLPEGAKVGNGYDDLGYPANGEASDWMLAVRGIYAFSPELGTKDLSTEGFFVYSSDTVKLIVRENYPWIRYTMMSL